MESIEIEKTRWGKRHLHLVMIGQLVKEAISLYNIVLVCFYYHRSDEVQHKLFIQGRSRCDGIKKPSKHQAWLAHDLCIVDEKGRWVGFGDIPLTSQETEEYKFLGHIWESYHSQNRWGGNFDSIHDVFHFQSF